MSWTVSAYGNVNEVMALIVLITLIPANLIVRERQCRRPQGAMKQVQKDWSVLRDMPFLLMAAGKVS